MTYPDVIWVIENTNSDHIASVRHMSVIPARTLGGRVASFLEGDDPDAFLAREKPRLLFFNKIFSDRPIRLAERAAAHGIPVVAILTDWHFENPRTRALAAVADKLVVQTPFMAAAVRQELGRESIVIEECYEGPRGEPRFTPNRPLRLLWYGHRHNLDTVNGGLRQIARLVGIGMTIRMVTNAHPDEIAAALKGLPEPRSPVELESEPWSLEREYEGAAWTDIVLIPSVDRPDKQVKGHDRLVQAIHAGRLAVAFPLLPYLDLGGGCWLGADIAEGIEWALANPAAVLERIREGQRYIDRRFSPEALAPKWTAAIEALSGSADVTTPLHRAVPGQTGSA
jgi:hypothetical protein